MNWDHVARILLMANLLFLAAVAVGLIAVASAAFLRPDPLAVVVETLEVFLFNQTRREEQLLAAISATLSSYMPILNRLSKLLFFIL